MMLIGEKTIFHLMHERNLLGRHHLALSPPSQQKTKERREPTWECSCRVVCKRELKQSPRACFGDAEVLGLDDRPFEKEMDALFEQ